MPQTNAAQACAMVLHQLRAIPAWPQLPCHSRKEGMTTQFSQGFPGAELSGDTVTVDRERAAKDLESFYQAYLEKNFAKYPITPDYAAGLYCFLANRGINALGVKGQITGPVTWGMTATDKDKKPILYDEILGDAVPKFLSLKAGWIEKELRRMSPNTIIFVDEPYLAAYGSVAAAFLSKDKITAMLEEVFSGISGIKGIHCCGNTDWSILLNTSADIVSFDCYGFAQSLALYPDEVKKFFNRKGAIAWGIVPSNLDDLEHETVGSLRDRLEEAMAPFTRDGISINQIRRQSLLTPSCGLASLPNEEAARRALELLSALSDMLRKKL